MKTKHFISILTVLFVLAITITGQIWEREYDEVAESGCGIWKLCETEDGYIYANLGKQNQMNIFKVKKENGEIIWHKEYRISNHTYPGKIFPIGEKAILIAGSTYDSYFLMIADSLGNEVKRKVWKPDGYYDGGLSDVIQNEDGTYTALGFLTNGSGYSGSYFSLVKFNQNLEIIWEKSYLPEKGDVYVQTIAKDDDCIIALGNIRGSYNNQQSGIIKFREDGEIIWQKTYPEPKHSFIAGNATIIKLSNGYLACNTSYQNGPDGAALMKLDKQGNIVWFNENVLQDTNYAQMINCWEIDNEYVGVVIAQPYSYPYVYPETYIVKTDTLGNLIYKQKWQRTRAFEAILTQDSSILIGGGLSESGYKPWVLKTYLPGDSIDPKPTPLPDNISLAQNFPNPFNSATTIEYQISTRNAVQIAIYDIAGKMVKMFQKNQEPGVYALTWDGKSDNGNSVASGVYIYQLITDRKRLCKKMVLEK